jgi:F0F1-type ATP synthase membrane subunit c/vacuolar-type H+-ATPase subunit K
VDSAAILSIQTRRNHLNRKKEKRQKSLGKLSRNRTFLLGVLAAMAVPSVVFALFSVQLVFGAASKAAQVQAPPEIFSQYGMGLLGAALAVTGSCLGAGIAIYGAASAGAAAIAERPEASIWVLILAGLGEGVAIYGLLIAIMILGKLPTVG